MQNTDKRLLGARIRPADLPYQVQSTESCQSLLELRQRTPFQHWLLSRGKALIPEDCTEVNTRGCCLLFLLFVKQRSKSCQRTSLYTSSSCESVIPSRKSKGTPACWLPHIQLLHYSLGHSPLLPFEYSSLQV